MTGNPQLEDLLDQFELARERGETLSPELLCQDCPELLPDFRTLLAKLAAVDGRLHRQADDDGATFGRAYGIANPRSPVSEIAVNLRLDRLDHEASGGIGDVFRARDQSFDRTVAVKFLQSDHANDRRLLSKFEFEAVVTGRLDHPSIVPVHGRGVAPNGQPYFVMRYLKGDTLEERIAKLHGPDGPRDARERNRHLRALLTHFVAACNAVAYAHSRSIVHRDIKPRNIKLQLFGETCVLDWGEALYVPQLGHGSSRSAPSIRPGTGSGGRGSKHDPVGTAGFRSPEQIEDPNQVDGRADVFGLGVTLYSILTGRLPFHGGTLAETDQKTREGNCRPPCDLAPWVPRPLEAICLKAIAVDREHRYSTPSELAQDVERWFADEPVSVLQESLLDRVGRWTRKHRAAALSILGSLALLIVVSAAAAIRQAGLAASESSARLSGLEVSATFAAKTIGFEMDRRWWILENEARSPELLTLLEAVKKSPHDHEVSKDLQAWIDQRFIHYKDEQQWTTYSSWFVCDAEGKQMARAPFNAKTERKSYRWRDYFHGRGHDLTMTEAADAEPIKQPHLSSVFKSEGDDLYKVTFSVPILAARSTLEDPVVVGVLGMSVATGDFGILEADLPEEYRVVLVDLRDDDVEQATSTGLVLHARNLKSSGQLRQPPRIGKELVAYLNQRVSVPQAEMNPSDRPAESVRSATDEPSARPTEQPLDTISTEPSGAESAPDGTILAADSPQSEHLLREFHDPLLVGQSRSKLNAGFCAVMIPGRGYQDPQHSHDGALSTGWVVLVQDTHQSGTR